MAAQTRFSYSSLQFQSVTYSAESPLGNRWRCLNEMSYQTYFSQQWQEFLRIQNTTYCSAQIVLSEVASCKLWCRRNVLVNTYKYHIEVPGFKLSAVTANIMDYKSGVYNAARDGNLNRLKVCFDNTTHYLKQDVQLFIVYLYGIRSQFVSVYLCKKRL